MLILITGGAGSGKSVFAEQLAVKLRTGNLYYFATMQIWDEECRQRILRHQQQRAGKGFQTIETPFLISEDVTGLQKSSTGLLECLSNLLANIQFDSEYSEIKNMTGLITEKIMQLYQDLTHLIIITNDIFSDRVPQDNTMKTYLKNLGDINCRLAKHAEIVIEINSGRPVIWKGEHLFHEIMV